MWITTRKFWDKDQSEAESESHSISAQKQGTIKSPKKLVCLEPHKHRLYSHY